MNTVTLETAKRLKTAGFPQPEFLFGQFWYAPNGTLCIIAGEGFYPGEIRVTVEGGNSMYLKKYDLVYAPTATDILQQMPSVILVMEQWPFAGGWEVWKSGNMLAEDKTPHEAAALAWLKLNEK